MPDPSSFWHGELHPEILTLPPRVGASNKGVVAKTSRFLAINVNISKTVGDTSKVTTNA